MRSVIFSELLRRKVSFVTALVVNKAGLTA